MVRFTLPAVLAAACCAAAPAAEASVVPVDVQSTVAATVEQVPAVASVATTVTDTAGPTVRHLGTQAAAATGAAAPAADPAVTAATGGPRELHTGASATPDRAARFTRPGRGHNGQGAARGGGRAAPARPPLGTAPLPAGAPTDAGDAARRTVARQERPAAPDPAPRTGGGTVASAAAAGFALGGAALIALAVCLAGPRLRRRLLIRPAVLRPVAFVALLERPG